jgi:hypothetical protein
MAPAAVPQTWEEILAAAQLSADESKLLEKVVQRVPEFKEGRLRQADYSRKSLELQTKEKDYNDAIATKDRVQAWFDQWKPSYDELLEAGAIDEESKPLWPEEKKRLAAELEAAKKAAVAGADMDPAELDKRVREIVTAAGGVTQAELKALVASEAEKLSRETFQTEYEKVKTEMNTKTIPFMAGFSAALSIAANKYEKETGKEFTDEDTKAVFALMEKEKNFNPREVVGLYMKPIVDKKATDAEVDRLAEEKARKMLADRGEAYPEDQPFIPMADRKNQAVGSLKRMLEESAAADGDIESLAMAAGHKAAAELRTEGKG